MERQRMRLALIIAAALVVGVAGGCAGSSPTASTSSPASPAATTASPEPVNLTLPTTIHPGNASTGGAALSTLSRKAKVSASRALAQNHLDPKARLTGTVLADVTMPNDFYLGKPIDGLTCWVHVYTFAKPFDPRIGGPPIGSTLSPAAPSMLVQHAVFILDASNGQFVRGFFTR
jgi:hypothetical protein